MSVRTENRQAAHFESGDWFKSIPGMYLIVDPLLRILDATDACLRATTSDRSDTVGRELNDDNLRSSVERAMRTLEADVTAIHHTESAPHSWRAVSTPVVGSDGILRHVIVELQDMTELEELRETTAKLRAASEAKNTYLGRMSHELRTPLTAVIGYSELLQTDAGLAPEDLQAAEAISKAGEHLLELTNDLLDITQIESGHMQMSIEPVPLQSVLQSAVALMTPLAIRTGVTLTLPEKSSALFVKADLRRLTQVLVNLLSNAIKYNRPNGRVSIEVTQSPLSGRVRLAVNDTGMGIEQSDLTKLFRPFERLGAEAGDVDGTGLGLSLTRNLVEEMGGTIDVESEVGLGTTFSVELAAADHPRR